MKGNGVTRSRGSNVSLLQEELHKLGIRVISSRQDTILSVQIKGLAGKALIRGLELADQLLEERIKRAAKAWTDPVTNLFTDPTFGPCETDPTGAAALCKAGGKIPSQGGSVHQVKVLNLLEREKLRWERPLYALEKGKHDTSLWQEGEQDEEEEADVSSIDTVFTLNATLFADGVSSGDVVQGNLGDCWFLSALSLVATRWDLLHQTFWRKDQYKANGLFVCRFMKNFVWHYVLIDDRFPVFGFTETKAGKLFFARCYNPDELWVSLLEKAYAKLHGNYETLIGGFVDCALHDLTGMCSEQLILKEGFPGFGENPLTPIQEGQKYGDPLWDKILRYKQAGTLMGCSIQPPVSLTKQVALESNAGNGLYFKHAYALVDAAEIQSVNGENVRLVKLRNPWGMGEWTGPWSDSSEERTRNEKIIERYFKLIKRNVGANAEKRVFMTLTAHGTVQVDEICQQEDVIQVNANDGTFFMSFDAWIQSFTHFFAGIDFPDSWHGKRVQGSWNEATCGGNITKATWINNPHFEFVVDQRAQMFISLSQEDARGSDKLKIVPIGFHICSLSPVEKEDNKLELKEPARKHEAYYRLYPSIDRESFQTGKRREPLPPAIIPGTVIRGIDPDGVPQPAYTLKQAVSVEATMEPGRYCIIPSMYMRTDQVTGNLNVGNFWLSVYSDQRTFRLEGGEKIIEEEEGDEDSQSSSEPSRKASRIQAMFPNDTRRSSTALRNNAVLTPMTTTAIAAEKRRKYETNKEELIRQATVAGIGLRDLRAEFGKVAKLSKAECRSKLQKLGFRVANWNDEKLATLFNGIDADQSTDMIVTDRILTLFTPNVMEEKMACECLDMEQEETEVDRIHREGILEIELHGATCLPLSRKRKASIQRTIPILAPCFSTTQCALRQRIAWEIVEKDPILGSQLQPFARHSDLLRQSPYTVAMKQHEGSRRWQSVSTPVAEFYERLENEYTLRTKSQVDSQEEVRTSSSFERAESFPSFAALSPNTIPDWTSSNPSVNAEKLHRTSRLQDLETKRSAKVGYLLVQKQQALGDALKTACLPRLLGGRKSGSSYVHCIDCGDRVLVSGRANRKTRVDDASNPSFTCSGANCVNIFCHQCYAFLPKRHKTCEDCYQHESSPLETFGEQLRMVLIEKMGVANHERSHFETLFASFDTDHSGVLTLEEFETMLQFLKIQPALTQGQLAFLVDQFDTNGDGEISLAEFQHWILQDHVWIEEEPRGSSSSSHEGSSLHIADAFETVIVPVCNEIIDLAFNAYTFSQTVDSWTHSASTTTACQVTKTIESFETGNVLFQRVLTLKFASDWNSRLAENVFCRVDHDGNGQVDQLEFQSFLSTVGIHLNADDTVLLMHCLGASSTSSGTMSIERSSFINYIEQLKMKSSIDVEKKKEKDPRLARILLKLEKQAATSPVVREVLQEELQTLHENMRTLDLTRVKNILSKKAAFEMSRIELRSLALNLSFDSIQCSKSLSTENESDKELVSFKSSGDFLARKILASTGDLMDHIKAFDALSVCEKLSKHFTQIHGAIDSKRLWKSLFRRDPTDILHQKDFIQTILNTGFTIGTDDRLHSPTNSILTSLFLSLAIDAVRVTCLQAFSIASSPFVSFSLFQLILQRQKIEEIELKVDHALANLEQFCQGEQRFLMTVALDARRNLIVRAQDPVFKLSADFILCEDEYDYENLLAHITFPKAQEASRELHVPASFHGLITSDFYPGLNASMLAIIERLRADKRPKSTTFTKLSSFHLLMVESNSFVCTLQSLFSQVEPLPFFWSVSTQRLVLSIDREYLEQLNQSTFPLLVAETLSAHTPRISTALRAFVTFVAHTASSLVVHYQVIGDPRPVETSWHEFQETVAGRQNAYAIIELQPQALVFTTPVARTSGSGAADWHFKTQICLNEPSVCDFRIDRPVVFTETVRVSSILGHSSMTDHIRFLVDDPDAPGAHFVVLSVRRALPSGSTSPNPRLYCTAYDPVTASDYAVEGYPSDWSVDFFDRTVNPSFECQWQTMLRTMRLGLTITPKLSLRVFTKQLKTDTLVGECQVPVDAAIRHEGHVFEDQLVLHSSTSSAGVASVTYHFDMKKVTPIVAQVATKDTKEIMEVETSTFGAQYLAGEVVPFETERVREQNKEKASSSTSIEDAKREAQEQVKVLQSQIQQLSAASRRASEDSTERWKRRFEQMKQEQLATEQKHATSVAVLQQEIRRLGEENETQSTSSSEAFNLPECHLATDASVYDLLSSIRRILKRRCPQRPYHGLKKALAAEAEVPGKVTFAVLNDVLGDFGLALSSPHRQTLSGFFDPETVGRVSIEDFFLKLCDDKEAYEQVKALKAQTPERHSTERVVFTPTPPPVQRSLSPVASPARVSSVRPTMTWQNMKQFLAQNLPEGWETRFTEKGRPYFCSHVNRSTQWKHPEPEIEAIFKEWVQENGAYYLTRKTSSSLRPSKQNR